MAKRDELKRHLKYWQSRLKLNDWQVTIRFASNEEQGMEDCLGLCEWDLATKTAEIRVLNPKEYDASLYPNSPPQDIEVIVIHELLHLHLAGWNPRNKGEEMMLEQAIEAISLSLVSFKRRKRA